MLTEYRGLNVPQMAALRESLRESGGELKVYKNTLVRFAARDLGIEIEDLLVGPTAIAFATAHGRQAGRRRRDRQGAAQVRQRPRSVRHQGRSTQRDSRLSADDVKALADVAPREQLLAELAGLMAAPTQQFVNLLDAIPRDFAYALSAFIEKNETAAA